MRLLIVDDNRNFGRFLYSALGTRGYETRVVTGTAHALASAREDPADLYLIDVMLPDGDGRTLASTLMSEAAATPEQIVIMTALDRGQLGDVSSVTAHPVLFKPFRLSGLLELLRERAERAVR